MVANALWASLGTLLSWWIGVLAGFVLLGSAIGHVAQHLVPHGQHHLPRSLIRSWARVFGVSAGLVCGLHAGIAHGVLTLGDRLAGLPAESAPIVEGIPGVAGGQPASLPGMPVTDRASALHQTAREEMTTFVHGGYVTYLISTVTLGHLTEPLRAGVTLARAAAKHANAGEPLGEALVDGWVDARPAIAAISNRVVMLGVVVGLFGLVGHALVGLVILLAQRRRAHHLARLAARRAGASRGTTPGVSSTSSPTATPTATPSTPSAPSEQGSAGAGRPTGMRKP